MQRKYGKLLICLLAFVLAGAFYCLEVWEKEEPVWETLPDTESHETVLTETQSAETDEEKYICVHICGAVVHPGVYKVPEGSRVYELLELAGGAADDGMADAMNLADILEDGKRIVIPTREEALAFQEDNSGKSALVNLNKASRQELMTLPGIGEAKAEDIIQYRETNGGFKQIEDIMKISGIKEALFQKIKDLITI